MIKNVKNAWKEKKNRLNSEFVGFKNGRIISVKNVKNHMQR